MTISDSFPGPPTSPAPAEDATPIRAGDLLFDERMGVHTVFLSVPRREWVYVKCLVETYEGLGVTRTLERRATDGVVRGRGLSECSAPGDAEALDAGIEVGEDLMVLMAVPDMVEETVSVLNYLADEASLRLVYPNEAYRAKFRADLLVELEG